MAEPENITIKLPGGTILAARSGNLFRARGLRYATAKRFQRAQPPSPSAWSGTVDCTMPAPVCPQIVPGALAATTGPLTAGAAQSEECLHVTVTGPASALSSREGKLPVMVYFHGGAFITGGADLDCYEPSGLACRGLVVVNVSYRLGVFGYLPIPDVCGANTGLLDQIAALEWVQDNIAAFGGDAGSVTVFGQSAGADSVFCLLLSEPTGRLFQRAVMQSPPLQSRLQDREAMTAPMSQLVAKRFAADSTPQTTDELLSLQTELLIVAKRFPGSGMVFGPLLGHAPLPSLADVQKTMAVAAKTIHIMVGTTANETCPFLLMMDSVRSIAAWPVIGGLLFWSAAWATTRVAFQWPAERLHRQYLAAGGRSCHYLFQWSPPSSSNKLGATHCIDLPFVLGTWDAWKDAPMLDGPGTKDAVQSLGREVKDLWAAFAKGQFVPWEHFIIDDKFSYQKE